MFHSYTSTRYQKTAMKKKCISYQASLEAVAISEPHPESHSHRAGIKSPVKSVVAPTASSWKVSTCLNMLYNDVKKLLYRMPPCAHGSREIGQ